MRHFYMEKKQQTGKDFAVEQGIKIMSTNSQMMYVHPKNIQNSSQKGEFQVLQCATLQGLAKPLITAPKFNLTKNVYKHKN